MTVERFGEARGAAQDASHGDGLAPVTYLFGRSVSPNPTTVTTPEETAGLPVSRDDELTSAERSVAALAVVGLPTLASVFGQLESEIEVQLAERHATDDSAAADSAAGDSAADIAAAERADARAKAKAERVSMNALTRRGMSKREVERSLRARELDEETIASELERLEGVGLIDDMALAQNLVGILQERKGLGRSAIAAELTRRLLTPAAIEYALDLVESSDELGRAREIAVKRAGQLRSYDHETAVRRLSAFLMRRGYSGSTVRAAVEHALPKSPGNSVRFR